MQNSSLKFISNSHNDTVRFGLKLGKTLIPGCIVGLIGDLGSGKTCFVKGIAYGINKTPENDVTSPTFTILQEYNGNIHLYHFDAYRLEGIEDLESIGLEDYMGGEGITVIEWADKISEAIPEESLFVYFKVINEHQRLLTFKAFGKQYVDVLEKIKNSSD